MTKKDDSPLKILFCDQPTASPRDWSERTSVGLKMRKAGDRGVTHHCNSVSSTEGRTSLAECFYLWVDSAMHKRCYWFILALPIHYLRDLVRNTRELQCLPQSHRLDSINTWSTATTEGQSRYFTLQVIYSRRKLTAAEPFLLKDYALNFFIFRTQRN